MTPSPPPLHRFTVGIVNYNGGQQLAATLASVARLGRAVVEVLLVDNASTDESVALARADFPSARVIPLPENRGPGAARNVIFREAACDRVLMIDNDVAPEPGCVELLSAALDANPRALIAMPAVLFARDPRTVQFVGADAHFLGTMSLRGAGRPADALDGEVHSVSSLVSACLMIDRKRFGGGPLFDESFFLYLEDHELGLRCRLMGLELLAVEGARCLHGDGTPGLSLRSTGQFTPVRVRHTILNRWQTVLKLYEARTLLSLAPALAAFELFQLGGALKKGWLGHWLWAAASLAGMLPDLLRRRRAFTRVRRRRDVEELTGGPFPLNPATSKGALERSAVRALEHVAGLNWRLASRAR